MAYALVTNGTIDAVSGRLPTAARRLDTGEWVMGLRDADTATQQATGWYEIQDTARPDDTPTTTHDRSVKLVADVPTVVWTERALTQAEIDAAADQADRDVDADDLKNEIQSLRDERDDASASKDNAALEVSEMTEFESDGVTPNPDWKNARWKDLREDWPEDGTITLAEVGEALNDLTKKTRWLQTGQRQQWVAIRKLWGNVRHLTAAFIRKLRKDRDDE